MTRRNLLFGGWCALWGGVGAAATLHFKDAPDAPVHDFKVRHLEEEPPPIPPFTPIRIYAKDEHGYTDRGDFQLVQGIEWYARTPAIDSFMLEGWAVYKRDGVFSLGRQVKHPRQFEKQGRGYSHYLDNFLMKVPQNMEMHLPVFETQYKNLCDKWGSGYKLWNLELEGWRVVSQWRLENNHITAYQTNPTISSPQGTMWITNWRPKKINAITV